MNIIEGYLNPYEADAWVVFKQGEHYRVLAGFNATEKTRASYRVSDRITEVRDTDGGDRLVFLSCKNTKYICRQEQYGMSVASQKAYEEYFSECPVLDEDEDWFSLLAEST